MNIWTESSDADWKNEYPEVCSWYQIAKAVW